MTFQHRPSFALLLILCLSTPLTAVAEEAASEETADDPLARFREEALAYEFVNLGSGKTLMMQRQPVLHWSNPARNGEDGLVYLWTDGDKPCVIGTFFTYVYNTTVRRKQSFRVLTNDAIRAKNADRVIWTPPTNSVEYRPLTDVPPPASVSSQRNGQLRRLARRFAVEVTLRNGRKEQCRLLPQPLYRYDSDESSEPAGAIFSFAVGTDPETLLILDRQNDESGEPRWHHAMVRFTFYPLEGFLDGKSIWKLEQSESLMTSIFARPDYQREPYVTFRAEWLDE